MNVIQHSLILSIRLYRAVLSPLQKVIFGPTAGCRFTPTCSLYAMEAIQVHGALKGSALAAGRLCRCHPWGGCGDDPVPTHYSFQFPKIKFIKFKSLHY